MIKINQVGLKNVKRGEGSLRADLVHRNTVVGQVVDDGSGPVVRPIFTGGLEALERLNAEQVKTYRQLGVQVPSEGCAALNHLVSDLLMVNDEVKRGRRLAKAESREASDLALFTERHGRDVRIGCALIGRGASVSGDVDGHEPRRVFQVIENVTPASALTISQNV